MSLDYQIALARNESIRKVGRLLLRIIAPLVRMAVQRRVNSFAEHQAHLRQQYGIDSFVAITSWNQDAQKNIDRVSAQFSEVRYAYTSGSTSEPKRIPYTSKRLHAIKRTSFESVIQTASEYNIGFPALFVLSAIQRDNSLSSLLLEHTNKTTFLDGLIMPSKFVGQPQLEPIVNYYGPTAVRLCLLVLSNPPILYGTNPSTIATFLDEVVNDWCKSGQLLRDVSVEPGGLGRDVSTIIKKVLSRGWWERVQIAASAKKAPALTEIVPGLKCYCCWDGGYVKPFLDTIRRYLPSHQYVHVPMYSMSTECLQTQTFFVDGTPQYLPITPGVLYEFLPEDAEDDPANLLSAMDLEVGQSYSMIVSDSYGLSRYQTEDVFLCLGKIRGIPDLRFLRRRGLTYSFTGEKITGKQVEMLYDQLEKVNPILRNLGAQMTLIPSQSDAKYPHYRLVVAYTMSMSTSPSAARLSEDFDQMLTDISTEFASKRESGRLGPTKAIFVKYDRFAQLMKKNDCSHARGWDNQFKLVPLFTKTWEELGLPSLDDFT